MSDYDEQIDALCDHFEEAWISGNRPSIAECIEQSDPAIHQVILENLIPLDVEYRIKLGEAIDPRDYADLGPHAIAIAETELQRNLARLAESKNEDDPDDGKQAIPVDLPGSHIGPYRLVEKIGEGGMGSVWLAQQTHPVRRSVALKLSRSFPIPRNLSQSQRAEFQKRLDELGNRFESERQTQAVMDHPNIAKVLDAGTTDDKRPYFVMELVDGSPINEYCDSVRATIRQRIDLIIQACKAIQHAHQKGIIHRDIKPSNVLVTTQDNQPIVKVIDFGLAKVTSEADKLLGAATPTQTGMIMGTYLYMSPEQAGTNTKDIDTRSDVYSLGVLLFELLTGSTPIDRARANELIDLQLLAAIREEESPRPSDRLSKLQDSGLSISINRQTDVRKLSSILRGELDWIALKALAKDRKRRYDGPTQLAEDLQRYLDGEAIVARPPSVSYRLRKTLRKHRIAVGVTALALTLITAGFIATYSQLQRAIIAEKASSENAEKEKKQRKLAEENLARAEKAESDALEARDMEKKQREIAETNLARATKAENETQERVKELEELTKFQESQFLNVDIQTMAMNLRQQLRDEYNKGKEGALEAPRSQFKQSIASLNLVDISRGFLQQNVISPAIKAAREKYANQPMFQASIFHTIAITADRIGVPDVPGTLCSEALLLRRENLGNEHPGTLNSIQNMALFLDKQGKSMEAEPLYREALDGYRNLLGSEHPDTLRSINYMARFLQKQGELSEAEPLYREALNGYKNLLGSENPDTLNSINYMAGFLNEQGKSSEAGTLYREALNGYRDLLGDEHPDTLTSINNMAVFLDEQGKSSEAEPFFREAIDGRRKVLGNEHPDTLRSISNLAVFLSEQGKSSEAEPLYREAIDGRRKLLGNEHPDTLESINGMATLLEKIGNSIYAAPLYREVLDGRRKVLGNEHPDTLYSINSMAVFLDKQGKSIDAESLYREALDGRKKLLGKEHPDTLISISNMAVFLDKQGRSIDAEPLYREALDGCRNLLGNEHPSTLTSINNLAMFFSKQGKSIDAEPLYRETLDGRRKLLGNEHPNTLQSINNLARSLDLQEKLDEAEILYREFLHVSQRVKTEASIRARGQVRLGSVLIRANKNSDEAKKLIEDGSAKLKLEIENVDAALRQKILDEAEAAMKLIEPAK